MSLVLPLEYNPAQSEWESWMEWHSIQHSTLDDSTAQLPITAQQVSSLSQQAGAFSNLQNFPNDAAAQAGGVPLGGLYRNGSVVMVRVT